MVSLRKRIRDIYDQLVLLKNNIAAWIHTGRSSTVTIAPSDASTTSKNQADVILTGINDQVLINAELSGAGRLLLKFLEGTVKPSAPIISGDFQHIKGLGEATVIQPSQNMTGVFINDTRGGMNQFMAITDLTIDGNGKTCNGIDWLTVVGTPNSHSRIERVHIYDCDGDGVHVVFCRELMIKNNIIGDFITTACTGYGIYMEGQYDSQCNDNYIIGNDSGGIYDIMGVSPSANTGTINNNYLAHNNGNGITVNQHVSQTVVGNTVEQNDGHGILVQSSYCEIVGNRVGQNGLMGIMVDNYTNNVIANNSVCGHTTAGYYGIALYISSNTCVGNNVYGNWGGIKVTNGVENVIVGNTIDSNTTWDGILLETNSDYTTIIGNFILSNGRWGISIGAGCDNCYIQTNHFYNNTSGDFIDSGANNRIHTKFYRVQNPDASSGYGEGLSCPDGSDTSCKMMCFIPENFHQLVTFHAVFIGETSPNGVLRYSIDTKFGKLDRVTEENYDTHTDSHVLSSHTCVEKKLELIDVKDCLTDVNYNDLIEAEFNFVGTDGANTVTGNFIGYYLRYV